MPWLQLVSFLFCIMFICSFNLFIPLLFVLSYSIILMFVTEIDWSSFFILFRLFMKLNPSLTNGEVKPVLFQNPTIFFRKQIVHRSHLEIVVI